MVKAPYDSYYTPRAKKVKHVHFIQNFEIVCLERDVNEFADKHPEYKILGIKLTTVGDDLYIATITYLCDAPGEFDSYNDYSDDEEEE